MRPFRTNLTAHTKHAPDSSGSSCYNCHMPYTTYGLLKTIRSHTVSSPSVAESIEAGRPNACNLCHLDKTLVVDRRRARASGTARRRPTLPIGDDERSIAASLLVAAARRRRPARDCRAGDGHGTPPSRRPARTGWRRTWRSLLDDPYDAVRFIAGRSLRHAARLRGVCSTTSSRRRRIRYQAQLTDDVDMGSRTCAATHRRPPAVQQRRERRCHPGPAAAEGTQHPPRPIERVAATAYHEGAKKRGPAFGTS